MKSFVLIIIFLFSTFFFHPNKSFSQNFSPDTSQQTPGLSMAIELYHQYLFPEPGLYNGSEYAYNVYYPFTINEGHPFFHTNNFDTGSVFYNNILYEKVPLMYDIIKGELLTRDPSQINIIRLNEEKIGWFIIFGHTFIRLIRDSFPGASLNTGFYDALYQGNTSLFKHASKLIKENGSSIQGFSRYVIATDEYYIEKNKKYFKIKNRKSLLGVLNHKKKEIGHFIKKYKLNLRKNKEDAFTRILAYYDQITANNNDKY